MRGSQPPPEKTGRKSAAPVVTVAMLILVMLPLLCLLGLGPAVRIHKNASPSVKQTIEVVYFWADPLSGRFPAISEDLLEWYIKWWLP